MMTLEWRYRTLVLRLLVSILHKLHNINKSNLPDQAPTILDAQNMLDEFRRNA